MWQRPIIQYIEEPSISALRVRAEKEEEMKTLEDYWKDRIQKQEVCSWRDVCHWSSDGIVSRTPSLPTLNWPKKKSLKMPNMSRPYLNQQPRATSACKFPIEIMRAKGGLESPQSLYYLFNLSDHNIAGRDSRQSRVATSPTPAGLSTVVTRSWSSPPVLAGPGAEWAQPTAGG